MALSKDDILNAIASMTVMDVVDLIKAMEEKFGVSAAAAVAVAPAAGGGAAAAPAAEEKTEDAPKLKINFNKADRVKINEGMFENFEGEVESIDEQNGRVTVMINIFGRSTPVELEYWQLETL